ncbi:MAG: transcriptional regulator [Alphaproteobacteria bacterium RIFOXYD12_FULL_60_8]|nr:MAG: transcriptional regulator [Alphaproteobacteria bacterium RIFOXYD12_FULL_60_8]
MRLGVDLGGTKIEVIALSDEGRVLARERTPTPRGDYAATLKAVRDLVLGVESRLGATGTLGVGIPGTVSPASGLIKNANSTWIIGHPLDKDLEALLQRPVKLANDADCFALSEAVDGAGQGADVVFGVILGTGVGGGVVAHGRLLSGPNAIAGEWGHNPLPWPEDDERPGPACYCGKHGCIETFLSGPGLALDFTKVTGQETSTFDIALGQTPEARAALRRYEVRLAKALATVINVIDPGVIVLGGGMSNLEPLYTNVPPLLGQWVFSDRVDTRISKAHHGDSSGVRGAAWLWPGGTS